MRNKDLLQQVASTSSIASSGLGTFRESRRPNGKEVILAHGLSTLRHKGKLHMKIDRKKHKFHILRAESGGALIENLSSFMCVFLKIGCWLYTV